MNTAAGPDFADLFAALPVAVLVVDPESRVAHANAECEALLNLSERAMLGQPLASILKAPED
ncbi:PAS domain-containing protein, partial [Klebsiella pneumoniae]